MSVYDVLHTKKKFSMLTVMVKRQLRKNQENEKCKQMLLYFI